MPMKERLAGPTGSDVLPHESARPMDAWNGVAACDAASVRDGDDGETYASASLSYVRHSQAWSLHISWPCARFDGTAARIMWVNERGH